MRLEGAVALVTGAGSGIGRAIAVDAAARGMHVALVGRRAQALQETAALAAHGRCTVFPVDLTDPAQRSELAARLERQYGLLHLLVNNAGVVHPGPVSRCDDAHLERMAATNLVAPVALVRVMLPLLRKGSAVGAGKHGARVLNVGSMFGDIAFPYFAAYSATKFALRGFSDALRRELADDGIGVTYAAPRGTRTPAADSFAHLVTPMGMRLDRPEDVARAILDAIERDRRSVYPRGPERFFVLLQRLFPQLIDANLGRLASRSSVRAALAGADGEGQAAR